MAYGMPPPSDPTNVMGRRVVAYLIDTVLLAGIVIAILAVTKDQVFTGAPSNACRELRDSGISRSCLQVGSRVYLWKGSGLALGYGVGGLAGILDLVVLQAVVGASIGKLIMGLRVVDGQGQKAGVGSVQRHKLAVAITCEAVIWLCSASDVPVRVTHNFGAIGKAAREFFA